LFSRPHEVVAYANRMVFILKGDRGVSFAVESRVVSRLYERPGLLLLLDLAADEILDIWMVGVQHDHLGRAPGLAARLYHARGRIGRFHEGKRARGGAARRKLLAARPQRREVHARAGTAFEDHPLVPVPVEDRVHVVLDLEDEAGGTLGLRIDPDVEIDGTVERSDLMNQNIFQLIAERISVLFGVEVAVGKTPLANCIRHPVNQLAGRDLAFL